MTKTAFLIRHISVPWVIWDNDRALWESGIKCRCLDPGLRGIPWQLARNLNYRNVRTYPLRRYFPRPHVRMKNDSLLCSWYPWSYVSRCFFPKCNTYGNKNLTMYCVCHKTFVFFFLASLSLYNHFNRRTRLVFRISDSKSGLRKERISNKSNSGIWCFPNWSRLQAHVSIPSYT